MGKEIQPQSETPSQYINELLVCQTKALISELWPDEFGPIATPRKATKKPAPLAEGECSAREEAVYQYAKRILLEKMGPKVSRPKLMLIQGGRAS